MKWSVSELLVVRDLLSDLFCKNGVGTTPYFLLHNNYDWQYYKLHYKAPPTISSPDPEMHDYGPKDPRALPK